MSKKLEFAGRAVEPGAKLAALCREYGISRPTGRKWRTRYVELGPAGLEEESRRPKSSPLSLEEELVAAVLEARDAHPSWGPKKLRQLLARRFEERAPSVATTARLLKRFGRIEGRRARRSLDVVERAPDVVAERPNDVWTVDFKGWWRCHDGSRCEPLTVRDAFSRLVLVVTLTSTTVAAVMAIFTTLFRKYGLPSAIQCDNGVPFVHVRARAGLSRLSAWWTSLGIRLIRGRLGCPQDNGAHERMHRDIAAEVERAPASTMAAQQRLLDEWRQTFNHVRPHDALGGKTPAEVYQRSQRHYLGQPLPPPYPAHFLVKRVNRKGSIRQGGEEYYITASLAGYDVGLEPIEGLRWKVWFYRIDCGELELLPSNVEDFVPPSRARPSKRRERHDARGRGRRGRVGGAPESARAGDAPPPTAEPNLHPLSA